MKPYYEADDVQLYLGDCTEILPSIGLNPDEIALISDPPYGMDYDTDSTRFSGGENRKRGDGRSDRKIYGDDQEFDPEPWLGFREVILWGSNHYAQKLPVGSTLIWLKRKPEHYGSFLSDAEIAWHSRGYGVYAMHAPDSSGRRRMEYTGSPFGKETAHVSQKPIALMQWCVDRCKSQTVFDPYMGSGSTGVAAIKRGKKFIGIEKVREYCDIAVKRISETLKQPDMFVSSPKLVPQKQESMFDV